MCGRASYMRMTRGTNLMQQTHTQYTRLHTDSLRPQPQHLVLEHNMQQHTTCTPEDGHIDVRNM